jgi:hypothetical protein
VASVNPTVPFTLLSSFIEILEGYFGEVSELSIKDNFDTIYELFEEVIHGGVPLTTEMVRPPKSAALFPIFFFHLVHSEGAGSATVLANKTS